MAKTLANLKSIVAAYHKNVTTALTVNGVDLFLFAVNNALVEAQMLHNFEGCRCTALLDIDANVGGNLSDATLESQSSNTVAVTGTLSPDLTGNYTEYGVFNGYPFFVLAGSPASFLYYNTAKTSYILSQTLTAGTPGAYFLPSPAQTTTNGSYVHGGTATGTATVARTSSSTFSGVREVLAVSRQRPDGTYIPLDFARADIPIERDRTELEFSDNLFPYLRYPSDAQINARGTNSSIIQRGENLSIYPRYTQGVTTPFNVRLECFGWLKELTASNLSDTSPSNFFLDYGFSWLQWYCIVETNYLFKTFVPRTEGNLASPEQARDIAWQKLTLYDSYRVDSNTTRSR
jgi:hypothetical protein